MIEELLKKFADRLDRNQIPYMIIGGQAVLLYGTPRLTRDIDITVGVDADQVDLMVTTCRELGLKILPENPDEFARQTNVLPAEHTQSGIRVDFIFSFSTYEIQALARAKKVPMSGYPVKFATCEDIIIHKMIAGRAVDEEDVKNILIKNIPSIDLEYIEKWLLEFRQIPEYQHVLVNFQDLRKFTREPSGNDRQE